MSPGPWVTAKRSIAGRADPGPRQGLADDGGDRLDVLAGGELRDDAPVRRMDLVLG